MIPLQLSRVRHCAFNGDHQRVPALKAKAASWQDDSDDVSLE